MRPFHETIVDAIRSASSRELACLAALIKATKIPKNHDAIIAAWNERCEAMCCGKGLFSVSEIIRNQKQEAEEKAANTITARVSDIHNAHGTQFTLTLEGVNNCIPERTVEAILREQATHPLFVYEASGDKNCLRLSLCEGKIVLAKVDGYWNSERSDKKYELIMRE